MATPHIFVSHSHQDNAWCRLFVAALQRLEYDVWYDETGLGGGDRWVQTIECELENREVFAIILTSHALASKWVQRELQLALTAERRIVPLLLQDVQVTGFLRTYQHIDATEMAADAAADAFDAAVNPHTASTQAQGLPSLTDGEIRYDEIRSGFRERFGDAFALGREAGVQAKEEVLERYTRAKDKIAEEYREEVERDRQARGDAARRLVVVEGSARQSSYEFDGSFLEVVASTTGIDITSGLFGRVKAAFRAAMEPDTVSGPIARVEYSLSTGQVRLDVTPRGVTDWDTDTEDVPRTPPGCYVLFKGRLLRNETVALEIGDLFTVVCGTIPGSYRATFALE